jgi:hypothetical protein
MREQRGAMPAQQLGIRVPVPTAFERRERRLRVARNIVRLLPIALQDIGETRQNRR